MVSIMCPPVEIGLTDLRSAKIWGAGLASCDSLEVGPVQYENYLISTTLTTYDLFNFRIHMPLQMVDGVGWSWSVHFSVLLHWTAFVTFLVFFWIH